LGSHSRGSKAWTQRSWFLVRPLAILPFLACLLGLHLVREQIAVAAAATTGYATLTTRDDDDFRRRRNCRRKCVPAVAAHGPFRRSTFSC
jgi:hypothetical protein